MIDFEKAERQIEGALQMTKSDLRREMLTTLRKIYNRLQHKDGRGAERALWEFGDAARKFDWDWGSGARMPRPFNRKGLEALYLQARKAVYPETVMPRRALQRPEPQFFNRNRAPESEILWIRGRLRSASGR